MVLGRVPGLALDRAGVALVGATLVTSFIGDQLPPEFVARVTGYADTAQKLRVLRLYRSARDPRVAFGPLADVLRALDVPACIIWGADDPYAKVRFAAPTAALFHTHELHVLERVGHWPFIDEPAVVARIVAEFLARCSARS